MAKRPDQPEATGEKKPKRKYEPPEIQSQEVFETTALACGKSTKQTCGKATKS